MLRRALSNHERRTAWIQRAATFPPFDKALLSIVEGLRTGFDKLRANGNCSEVAYDNTGAAKAARNMLPSSRRNISFTKSSAGIGAPNR